MLCGAQCAAAPPPPSALSAPSSSSSGAERSFPPPSPLALSAPSCASSGAERSLLLLLLPPPQLLSIRIAILCPSQWQLAQHATSVGLPSMPGPEIDNQDASKREANVGSTGQVPDSEVGYNREEDREGAAGQEAKGEATARRTARLRVQEAKGEAPRDP